MLFAGSAIAQVETEAEIPEAEIPEGETPGDETEPVEEPDPVAGMEFALDLCAECHAVFPGTDSPEVNAPPFPSFLINIPIESLEDGFADVIAFKHSEAGMPEFELTDEQINNIIAFLFVLFEE